MLYQALALLAGAMIAVMVAANGLLNAQVGLWMSLAVIHVCGLITIGAILLIRRKPVRLRAPGAPWYLYLGGVGGVLTTALNNLCFEPLGAALMLAMVIVGQLLGSSLVDHFGWFGLKRHPFRRGKLAGFGAMALGLLLMTLWQPVGAPSAQASGRMSTAVYALLALATGINLSLTTTLNASLGSRVGVFSGTLVNYLAGLAASLACLALLGSWAAPSGIGPFSLAGGVLGAVIVTLSSLVMPRISVVYSTILMFVGQIAAGMAIDAAGGLPVTPLKAAGCAVIAAGLLYNMRVDRRFGQPEISRK